MIGKFTLLVLGLMALATLTLAQSSIRDETEPPGSVIDIDTEISKEKEEVPEESGSGKSSDDEDDEDEDDLDKSSGSGSGGFNTDHEEPPTTTMKTLKGCANLYESSKHLLGNFVPQCDDNGDYLPKQCRGHASTGRCWCVDNHGAEIPGTAKEPPNDLDCVTNKSLSQCVFKVVEAVRNPKKLLGQYKPQCKINGDFEPRQCHGSMCFCVDQDGIQQYGTRKPIHLVTDDMCKEKTLPEVPEESITVRVTNPVKNTKPVPTKPVNPEYTIPSKNPIVEVEAPISPDEDDSTEDKTKSPNTTGDDEDDGGEDSGPLKEETKFASAPIMTQPGLLAAIIGGAVVGLLCAILLVMFIVYRMRKKDEGSYALDEPRKKSTYSPINQTDKEYYA